MLYVNFHPFPELATGRLVLRQLRQADAPEIFLLRSDVEVNKYIDRQKAATIDEAGLFIENILEVITRNEGLYWGIHLKTDPKLIGTICFWNIDEGKQTAEIGYELMPAFQGQGIMQEAIERVIEYGFEKMCLEIITAFTHHGNTKSIRLLQNNHFIRNEKLDMGMAHSLSDYVLYTLPTPGKSIRESRNV